MFNYFMSHIQQKQMNERKWVIGKQTDNKKAKGKKIKLPYLDVEWDEFQKR